MSSTVTTSTVSTVAAMAVYGSIGLLMALTLMGLLINKEILTTSNSALAATLRKVLNIVIIPLIMAFSMIAVVNLIDVVA